MISFRTSKQLALAHCPLRCTCTLHAARFPQTSPSENVLSTRQAHEQVGADLSSQEGRKASARLPNYSRGHQNFDTLCPCRLLTMWTSQGMRISGSVDGNYSSPGDQGCPSHEATSLALSRPSHPSHVVSGVSPYLPAHGGIVRLEVLGSLARRCVAQIHLPYDCNGETRWSE